MVKYIAPVWINHTLWIATSQNKRVVCIFRSSLHWLRAMQPPSPTKRGILGSIGATTDLSILRHDRRNDAQPSIYRDKLGLSCYTVACVGYRY